MFRYSAFLKVVAALGLVAGCATSTSALKDEPTTGATLDRHREVFHYFRGTGLAETVRLSIRITLPPKGNGPFPAVVLAHGSPGKPSARKWVAKYPHSAPWFLSRGIAVIVFDRRGYGRSSGDWAEGFGDCAKPDYVAAGTATADDLEQVVRALSGAPWLDHDRLVVVGVSAGGFGGLALASRDLPIRAIVNLAGGRGAYSGGVCGGDAALVSAARTFGQANRLDTLWFYAENDRSFGPTLARAMHGAFRKALPTGRATAHRFVMFPARGKNGHPLLSGKGWVDQWGPYVESLFRDLRG